MTSQFEVLISINKQVLESVGNLVSCMDGYDPDIKFTIVFQIH